MHDMGPISCHIYFVTTWSRGEELPHKCSILAFEKPVVVSYYIFMFDAMHNLKQEIQFWNLYKTNKMI